MSTFQLWLVSITKKILGMGSILDPLPYDDGLYSNDGTVPFRVPPHPRPEARGKRAISSSDVDHVS